MTQNNLLPLPTFKSLGVNEKSEGKVVIFRLNITPEEWNSQSDNVKKVLYINEAEKEEVHRYLNMDETTKKIIQAFVVANNTLYFNDNSDYVTALWEICEILNPSDDKEEDNYTPQFINVRD